MSSGQPPASMPWASRRAPKRHSRHPLLRCQAFRDFIPGRYVVSADAAAVKPVGDSQRQANAFNIPGCVVHDVRPCAAQERGRHDRQCTVGVLLHLETVAKAFRTRRIDKCLQTNIGVAQVGDYFVESAFAVRDQVWGGWQARKGTEDVEPPIGETGHGVVQEIRVQKATADEDQMRARVPIWVWAWHVEKLLAQSMMLHHEVR